MTDRDYKVMQRYAAAGKLHHRKRRAERANDETPGGLGEAAELEDRLRLENRDFLAQAAASRE